MTDRLLFQRPPFGAVEGDPPFELVIARAGVYTVLQLGDGDALELLFQIQRELDEDVPLMDFGDLGLTDPDDFPF